MDPHQPYPASMSAMFSGFRRHAALILHMTKREVIGRYRGSVLGLSWSLFHPILMLAVYTFVFSFVFKARWGIEQEESKADFALVLFVGLIIHAIFAEVLNRSPRLMINHVNYVKKIVFPLEILPVVTLGAALFHGFVSAAVLLTAYALINGYIQWSALLFPLILLPFLLMTLGLAWILTSLGTYLRDIGHAIGMITTILLFLSPVFYSVSMLPEPYRALLYLNPLTFIIEQSRAVLIQGISPDYRGLFIYSVVSCLVAWCGYFWFQKTRKGFSDVL